MKEMFDIKRLVTVLLVLLLAAIVTSGNFSSYAEDFTDFELSADGGVSATYHEDVKELLISGAGVIEYARWKAMAQRINSSYFNSVISWGYNISEDDIAIIFNGEPKAIKLCGTEEAEKGLFRDFSGQISFNGAVDLAPAVTDISFMFYNAVQFNESVDFDTSSVIDMSRMFRGATTFNKPVNFDTRQVINMTSMFSRAKAFNQPLSFDTKNVLSMYNMFSYATSFNRPLNWDTSKVVSMSYMFDSAAVFNESLDFDTGNVTDMSYMFKNAEAFNMPLQFDTTQVTDMSYMFNRANSFNRAINFNTINVTNMDSMFRGASAFDQPLTLNTSKVTNMSSMFNGATAFNKPINFDTANVTDMSYMFNNSIKFNQPVVFDTTKVTTMNSMFHSAETFNQAVDFDTTSVTNMSYMFFRAIAFNQPTRFNTTNVESMRSMFAGAESFNQALDFDTSNVLDMCCMLSRALSFNQPIAFNIESVNSANFMFKESPVEWVVLDNAPENLDVEASNIFSGCTNLRYLQFSGLRYVAIQSFSGDYFIVEEGAEPIAKSAIDSYSFSDNRSYSVYLQDIELPQLSLNENGAAILARWTAASGVSGYQVYRSDKVGGPYLQIGDVAGLTYDDDGPLIAGMPYFYRVRAYRQTGEEREYGALSEWRGYYAPGELATPDKPNLTLDENVGGIRLNWDEQDRIIGYQVYRSLSPDKPFSYLKTASGNVTRYTNLAGLTPGKPFYYKIRAYRKAKGVREYGPFSDVKGMFAGTDEQALDAVSFSLEDNPNVSAPNVRVRWTGVSGADGYCVYRWNSAAQNWTGLKLTGPDARVYTNINGVVNDEMHYYGMRTYHISGDVTYYGNIGKSKGFRVDK